ncbi:MAG: ADP-ribosylglycohydrolase family protein [Rhodopirellula sp.]|nr:ADP-ribosylglycohydrolase family protein [Rhodopirellula sp.]
MTSRQRGCLIALAVGDALGAAIEFRAPGTFKPVTGYRSGGPHGLAPGEWTDDTSMALEPSAGNSGHGTKETDHGDDHDIDDTDRPGAAGTMDAAQGTAEQRRQWPPHGGPLPPGL